MNSPEQFDDSKNPILMEEKIPNKGPKPEFVHGPERKLVGIRKKMSISTFDVSSLWQLFIPRRAEIEKVLNEDLVSIAQYSPDHFSDFDPIREFEKWAAVEVSAFVQIPSEMEAMVIPAGLYAVFPYRGHSHDTSIYQYIFRSWLPGSGYMLDQRPHFEILGEHYRNDSPESEEEIWIPIRNAGL